MMIRSTKRTLARAGVVAIAVLAVALSALSFSFGQEIVRKGRMERRSNTWLEQEECDAPVKAGSRLILRVGDGSVQVNTTSDKRVTCEVALRAFTRDKNSARRLFNSFKLAVRRLPGGGVFVNGLAPAATRESIGANYRISVPAHLSLDLETRGGNISVAGAVEGWVRITTAVGDIRIGPVSGRVQIATAAGNLTLGNVGSSVEARTAAGTIQVANVEGDASLESNGGGIVAGQIGGTFHAETAGGDVALESAGGAILAETSGGQIRIGKAGRSVRAETAGGSVRIEGARGQVQVQSDGGSIDLFQLQGPVQAMTRRGSIVAQIAASAKAFNPSTLETSTGDIQVYLPQSLPITIDAAIRDAAGHRIISDFPLAIQGESNDLLKSTVRGHAILNGGGKVLRIRCAGGNIEIFRLNKQTLERLKVQKADYRKPGVSPGP